MFRRSRAALLTAGVALTGLLTACGIAGTAIPGELDVRKLEVGPYPVDKYRYEQSANGKGTLLEGIRMADAVVPAVRIDPTLTAGIHAGVVPDSDQAINGFLASVSKPILDRHKMVVGYETIGADQPFTTDRGAGPGVTVDLQLLMRFPSEADATQAARELESADFDFAPGQNRRLQLSEYPNALIHWRPGVPNIGTFVAYREFVVFLFIQRPSADERDLLGWVRKTLDNEMPVLEKFRPTPLDKIDTLQVDPEGLLARVAVRDRTSHSLDPALFSVQPAVALVHTATNQAAAQRMIDETGIDAFAVVDNSIVFRVRDRAQGPNLITQLSAGAGDEFDPIDGPKDVPGAQCQRLNPRGDTEVQYKNRCYVAYQRYVGFVTSDNEADVRQRVAAQYALLANSL
ncbi:hypothetical protein OG874_18725 [Nocardia sp. NBC_00565]|uniref:DUF7373 family lipoprotein n=1 Tax=Nocardia sp. NBC_00565 TaxID=2975993 RepID=UPI002E80723E|nr:hypothetical protein [Nocardia sp. NBC_00565]WUC07005.1 hypothetical protein OG874_18725 [Nocardia sp. NBC_00565]